MKVYGLFRQEVHLPFIHETLVDLYEQKESAQAECNELNTNNLHPMQEDSYGPVHGCKFFVTEIEVK